MEFVKRREIKRLISDGAKDIVTFDEYASNKELYANTKTAIEIEDGSGVVLALPYRSKGDGRPGAVVRNRRMRNQGKACIPS